MIVAAIVLFVIAVAVVATTAAAATGLLKINSVAGIRIPSVTRSPAAWEAGHLAALLPVTIAGVVAVVTGFVVMFRPGSGAVLIVAVILLVALLAFAVVRADRAARSSE